MGRWSEQTFLYSTHKDAQKVPEKMLNTTNIRETHIETTMRCYFTPVRMAIIKDKK